MKLCTGMDTGNYIVVKLYIQVYILYIFIYVGNYVVYCTHMHYEKKIDACVFENNLLY